jgi:hypothetical protein
MYINWTALTDEFLPWLGTMATIALVTLLWVRWRLKRAKERVDSYEPYKTYDQYRRDLRAYTDGWITLDELLTRCGGAIPRKLPPRCAKSPCPSCDEQDAIYDELAATARGWKLREAKTGRSLTMVPRAEQQTRGLGDVALPPEVVQRIEDAVRRELNPLAYGVEQGVRQGLSPVTVRAPAGLWVRHTPTGVLGRVLTSNTVTQKGNTLVTVETLEGKETWALNKNVTIAVPMAGEWWTTKECSKCCTKETPAQKYENDCTALNAPERVFCGCLVPVSFGTGLPRAGERWLYKPCTKHEHGHDAQGTPEGFIVTMADELFLQNECGYGLDYVLCGCLVPLSGVEQPVTRKFHVGQWVRYTREGPAKGQLEQLLSDEGHGFWKTSWSGDHPEGGSMTRECDLEPAIPRRGEVWRSTARPECKPFTVEEDWKNEPMNYEPVNFGRGG